MIDSPYCVDAASVPAYLTVIELFPDAESQKFPIIGCVAALYATHDAAQPLANDFGRFIVKTVSLADGPVPVVKRSRAQFCPPTKRSVTGLVPAPAA